MKYGERASQTGKSKIANKPAELSASPTSRLAGAGRTRLVFFGTEDFSVVSLEALVKAGWPISVVVTKQDAPAGRGQKLKPPAVKMLAEKHKIPVLQPAKVADINDELVKLRPGLGVLVAYGKIIPQSTLDLFPDGIVNVHPSLLPKYRGPSPIEAAILNGDDKTGVSLMKLTAGMDKGPIYAQKAAALSGHEDRWELYKQLAEVGAELLITKLPDIIDKSLSSSQQENHKASYTKLLTKPDGRVDFNHPAETIEHQIRAYLGYPRSRARLHGQEIIITKARLAKDKDDGTLVVACQPGYLEILELVAPSGRTVSGADFLRGYQK